MAPSLDAPSSFLDKESPMSMSTSSAGLVSPTSDKHYWSTLRRRVDSILDRRHSNTTSSPKVDQPIDEGSNRAKRLKEDAQLLLRGFDSIANSLSQLTDNLDNALQGARHLSKPPTLTEMLHIVSSNSEKGDNQLREPGKLDDKQDEERKAMKRKFEPEPGDVSSDDQGGGGRGGGSGSEEETNNDNNNNNNNNQQTQVDVMLKRAKNLATLMAGKASSLSRELKSVKSDLYFVQERCALLEEENQRLRDGFVKGVRPEEDDLVRLQLEALLAEKSRLANENANLTRENQCLRQLVEYHQFAARDILSSPSSLLSYDVMEGVCLDFSSPIKPDDNNVEEFAFAQTKDDDVVLDSPPLANQGLFADNLQ